jgi:uncharacterized membrane protein
MLKKIMHKLQGNKLLTIWKTKVDHNAFQRMTKNQGLYTELL